MQQVGSRIEAGSRLIFWRYLDEETMDLEERIFMPGQFLVVGAINDDGGLQCYPTDEDGVLTATEGDTLFDEEVFHLTYAPRLDVATIL